MANKKLNELTIKQEDFCQAYILTGDKSAAYRQSYSYKNMKETTVYRKAQEVFLNGKVSARIQALQSKAAIIAEKKFQITAEEMLRHLNILRSSRMDDYVTLVYEKVATNKTDDNGEVVYTEVPRAIFKPFDELTPEQLMCIESLKVNRYGEIELKLHGKEWTIEKINKHIGFYKEDNEQKKPEITNEIDVSKLSNKALDELEKAYNEKK
jgi:phage terminase small subunit